MAEQTDQVRHPIFARLFTKASVKAERRGQAEHRRRLLAGLSGRVIEVGAGNGLNFAHYPSAVSEVVAVEPEPYLRARAEDSAVHASVPVRVIDGLADRLPVEDESFDAGIASLLLCSVPDQGQALGEFFRVIRSGGELRFYEHVASKRPFLVGVERVFSTLVYSHVVGGCHLNRDTGAAIERAGFRISSCERFPFTPCPFPPRVSHILGAAQRP